MTSRCVRGQDPFNTEGVDDMAMMGLSLIVVLKKHLGFPAVTRDTLPVLCVGKGVLKKGRDLDFGCCYFSHF